MGDTDSRFAMALRAQEVFTPGSFPQHTYVERTEHGLEVSLRDALDTPGQLISLSGPSKSGKTVLVEKVVGEDLLITITGASIKNPDDVWEQVLNWMDLPNSVSSSVSSDKTLALEGTAKGSAGVPFVAKGEIGAAIRAEATDGATTETVRGRRGLRQVVDEIANSEFVVLLDDFHYMDREVQVEVAKSLKEAVRLGVKIVTAAVTHRGDDVLRANPELRGRVLAIDLKYWSRSELRAIADVGFEALNASMDQPAIERFVDEAAGSPQLMQSLCLQTCFVFNLREKHMAQDPRKLDFVPDTIQRVFEQTSATTDFRSLFDVVDAGPRTRGTERKTYRFHDGTDGDVYRVVMRAVSSDPPRLSFTYEELLNRTAKVCSGDSPVGSSVTGTCLHMAKLALERFPKERAIDWDESKPVLELPDPYFMFYLRWSGCLQKS
jgi:hypothetical protein